MRDEGDDRDDGREPTVGGGAEGRVGRAIDEVRAIWSSVGLATLMAEIHRLPTDRIVAILEELATAGESARAALLGGRDVEE